jgi:hypothetical protein
MRIQGNGNVGIGTTAPSTKLDITKSTAFNATTPGLGYYNLHLSAPQNGVNDEATGITFGTTNNLNAQAGIYVQNSALYGTFMRFGTTNNYGTGSQTRMTIDNLGNVGIGSTDPVSKLEVKLSTPKTNSNFNVTQWLTSDATNPQKLYMGYLGSATPGIRTFLLQTEEEGVSSTGAITLQPYGGVVNIGAISTQTTTPLNVRNDNGNSPLVSFANITNNPNANNPGLFILAGANAPNTGSYHMAFLRPDATTIGSIYQNSATTVGFYTTSDIRIKTNIHDTKLGLKTVMNIDVKDYNYKEDLTNEQTGFIAQQLYEQFPQAVSKGGDDAKTEPWMVDYGKLTPLLVKGMQEQQAQIEALKVEIEKLKASK